MHIRPYEVRMTLRPVSTIALGLLCGACLQDGPAPYSGGPRDPNSSTVFNLSLTPDSLPNCMTADSSMTRPMTVTVQNDTGTLFTAGGIHYGLTRVGPNIYAGGDWIKIRANLAAAPKTLSISTNDSRCTWTSG
jgi:hypothetical protein